MIPDVSLHDSINSRTAPADTALCRAAPADTVLSRAAPAGHR